MLLQSSWDRIVDYEPPLLVKDYSTVPQRYEVLKPHGLFINTCYQVSFFIGCLKAECLEEPPSLDLEELG